MPILPPVLSWHRLVPVKPAQAGERLASTIVFENLWLGISETSPMRYKSFPVSQILLVEVTCKGGQNICCFVSTCNPLSLQRPGYPNSTHSAETSTHRWFIWFPPATHSPCKGGLPAWAAFCSGRLLCSPDPLNIFACFPYQWHGKQNLPWELFLVNCTWACELELFSILLFPIFFWISSYTFSNSRLSWFYQSDNVTTIRGSITGTW